MIDSKTDTARRIIIIDDNQAVHRDFESILVECMDTCPGNELEDVLFGTESVQKQVQNRYELGFASQGREGLRMIENALADGRPYMLAFVDMRMPPGWDGLETIEHIWEVDPDIQVVICSAYCDYSWSEMTDKLGRRDNLLILEKPFDINEVTQLAAAMTEKWLMTKKASANVANLHHLVEEKTCLLKAEKERLQRYLDIAGVIMVALDADLNVLMINREGCRILGYQQKDIVGRNWADNFMPEEFRADIKAVWAELRADTARIFDHYENPILTREGTPRHIAWHNVVIRDERGRIEAILGSGEDITERIESERVARAAYARLERANQELKAMHSQLLQKEKLVSIGQLAAGVAHEINNPVGFVSCNFEVLQGYTTTLRDLIRMYEELAGIIPVTGPADLLEKSAHISEWRRNAKVDYLIDDMKQLILDSRDGLDRISAIVQNLRGFSSIDQAVDMAEYSINDGVRSTVAVLASETRPHCSIQMDLGSVPSIVCNAGQINQVLLNIITNASQAIESQARSDSGTIAISTAARGDAVVCAISDDGPGIPQEHWPQVFDPFFTTKPVGKGTGLGLSVSHDIIANKHKGRLLFESTPGKGTTFTIELPMNRAALKEDSI